MTPSRSARRFFLALSLLYAASAALALTSGGYSFYVLGLRLSSRRPLRDLLLALTFGALGVLTRGTEAANTDSARLVRIVERAARSLAAIAALVVFGVGVRAGTYCACGSDSYGYVSEAFLWLRGSLHVP